MISRNPYLDRDGTTRQSSPRTRCHLRASLLANLNSCVVSHSAVGPIYWWCRTAIPTLEIFAGSDRAREVGAKSRGPSRTLAPRTKVAGKHLRNAFEILMGAGMKILLVILGVIALLPLVGLAKHFVWGAFPFYAVFFALMHVVFRMKDWR